LGLGAVAGANLDIVDTIPDLRLIGDTSKFRFVAGAAGGVNYLQTGASTTDEDAVFRITRTGTGTTNIKDFQVYANTTYFSGNVGIRTQIPNATLHIQGGQIVSGNLDVGGNATYNSYYGGMYMHNDAGLASTFNETYQKLYFNESDYLNGFTFADSTLTLKDDGGLYQARWNAVGTGTNNHEYHGYVFVNEQLIDSTIGHGLGTGNNEISVKGLGFVRINNQDNITVRLADLTAESVGTQIHANINLVRIGN